MDLAFCFLPRVLPVFGFITGLHPIDAENTNCRLAVSPDHRRYIYIYINNDKRGDLQRSAATARSCYVTRLGWQGCKTFGQNVGAHLREI